MLMMIKRSNRGKLSGSLGGRALPDMRKGAQHKRRHPLPYALILVLGLVLSLGMVPATAEAEISGPPAHDKSATKVNNDGTVDVTLNVTGAVDKHSKSSKSDVIVVLDLSGSMNAVASPDKNRTYYTGETYDDGSKCEVKYYEGDRGHKAGWYYVYGNRYLNQLYEDSDFYSTTGNETTRLGTAKSAVESLVKELLANNDASNPDLVHVSLVTFSNVATVKVPLTNNETTIDNAVNGLTAVGGTNWEDALNTAAMIKTREGASASVVFVSDGDPTYRATLGNKELNFKQGTDSNTGKHYYGEGNGDSLNQNYNYAKLQAQAIVKKGWEFYSVAAFGNVNNMSKLVTDAGEQAEGHFFKASDRDALNKAFESIVKSITTTVSYTDVSIHDSLSDFVEYVLPSSTADEPTFTYMRNGEPWNDAPAAHLNKDGAVVWNVGDLDPDTTYSVTFKVRLTQAAYDAAAPKDGVKAVSDVKTNSDVASKDFVRYTIKTDVDGTTTTGEPQQSEYKSPTVTVPTSILHVKKFWETNGWENVSKPSQLQVKVKQQDNKDNKYYDYKTVTLNADNNWSYDVVVAAGPEGHNYTVEEVGAPEGWVTKLPDDVAFLHGWTKQEGNQEITNALKTAKLTITKSVTGNFGDTSKYFSFTLTDASGKAITNVNPVDGTSNGVILGNDGSFKLKDGQKLVVELPYGATYKVFENDPNDPKGAKDTVNYTTSVKSSGGSATTDKEPRTASSPEGGITKDTTIAYTNKRDVTPDVGVDLGSGAPYAAVFGGVGIAGVIWMVLKRRNSLGI